MCRCYVFVVVVIVFSVKKINKDFCNALVYIYARLSSLQKGCKFPKLGTYLMQSEIYFKSPTVKSVIDML